MSQGFTKTKFIRSTASRNIVSVASVSLASGAVDSSQRISLGESGLLFVVQTDIPARVILYATSTARTSDASRTLGQLPTRSSGVIAEVITSSTLLIVAIAPSVPYLNLELPPVSNLPLSITNLSGSTSIVNVTMTYLAFE